MSSKTNTPKASQTTARAAESSKAGAATSPQSTAGTWEVADGQQVSLNGKILRAGEQVSAADLKSERDPDGKRGLQRLIEGGELVKSTRASRAATTEKDADDRAGGGAIDNGGAVGAGPSGAQIIAAETGNDEGAAAVVDAALSGTVSDLEKAADPNADQAKG